MTATLVSMGVSMPQSWQKIDAQWLVCHWWQDLCQGRITAMTTILTLLALAALVVGLVGLTRYVRGDTLAAGHYVPRDELGSLAFLRRAA
jgi:hypothetical protein